MRLRRALGLARDTILVLQRAPEIERRRVALGPEQVVHGARVQGAAGRRRDARGRRDLQRLIRAVDACWPGGPSCYRRVLLELAVDAGAADEPVQMGIRVNGGPRSGHAWLGARVELDGVGRAPYDAIISI